MADNKNTPKPKPSVKKVDIEVPAISEVVAEVEAEVVAVPLEEEAELAAPEVYTEKPVEVASVPSTTYAVVSNDAVDTVVASKIVIHNKLQKKSLSVHHLQRRLREWGFNEAYLDRDGYCGDHTVSSIAAFQKSLGLPATGTPDFDTLCRLFEGDTNIRLVP